MRALLHRGLQASVNSDDPGFLGYEGVTLDYVYLFIAWELSIRDLKKFSLNGIKYSTVSEGRKEELYQEFFHQWSRWIDDINSGSLL